MKLSGAKKVMLFASFTTVFLIALSFLVSAEPTCFQDSDCGFTGFFGTEQCSETVENSVTKSFQNSTCLNPGTEEAVCSVIQEPLEVNSCQFACFEGTCILCDSNLDCSDSDPNTIDLCLNPGTLESRCSNELNSTALIISDIETFPVLPHSTLNSDLNISLNFSSNRYPLDLQFIFSKNSSILDVSEVISILSPEDLPIVYSAENLEENMTYQLSFNVSDSLENSLEFFLGNISRSIPFSDPIFLEIISPEPIVYSSNLILINISSNSENISFFNGTEFVKYLEEVILEYEEGSHIFTARATNSTSTLQESLEFSIDLPSSGGGGGGSSSSGGQILRLSNKTESEETVYFIPIERNISPDPIFLESKTSESRNSNVFSNKLLQLVLIILSALFLFFIFLLLASRS